MFATNARTYLTRLGVSLLLLLIAGYVAFEFRHLIEGPKITLSSPLWGEAAYTPTTEIIGTVQNVSYLSLNERQVYVDSEGNLNERILLLPGYNLITLTGKDRFGRTRREEITLIRQ